jgi:hypothetical protein
MPTPFDALDGFRFWYRGDVYILRADRYHGNQRGALFIFRSNGEVEDKLTVNLPEGELGPDEFFVKWSGDEGALTRATTSKLWKLGLFEDTGRRVDSGYVEAYAAAWTFKRCWWNKHSGKDGFRVLCPECRADFAKDLAKHEEERDAREALGRLETLSKIERGQTPTSRAFGRFGISSLKTPRKR